MIGWLGGSVVHNYPNGAVVVDVNGVGYEVHVCLLYTSFGVRS